MTKHKLKEARELAYVKGDFRERYAMNHGVESIVNLNGHLCFIYLYSESKEYQDANGATYDITERKWVN